MTEDQIDALVCEINSVGRDGEDYNGISTFGKRDELRAVVRNALTSLLFKDTEMLDWLQETQNTVWRVTHEEWERSTDVSGRRRRIEVFDGWSASISGEPHKTIRAAIAAAMKESAPTPTSVVTSEPQLQAPNLAREVKNALCIDGHLNNTLDKVLSSTSPDAIFCLLTSLGHTAVDMAFAARLTDCVATAGWQARRYYGEEEGWSDWYEVKGFDLDLVWTAAQNNPGTREIRQVYYLTKPLEDL